MPLTAGPSSPALVHIVGPRGDTWSGYVAECRCLTHADSVPSLSIRQGDRRILVTCFAGCVRDDVLRKLPRMRRAEHCTSPTPQTRSRQMLNESGIRLSMSEARWQDGI